MKTAILSLLIALAVTVFSWFQFETFHKFMLETRNSIKLLQSENIVYAENRDASNKSVQQEIDNLQKTVQGLEQRVLSKEREEAPQLVSIETSHLIRLAFAQLNYAKDLNAAISLLEMADKNLQDQNDSKLSTLRQAINSDLMTLKTFKLPDLTNLWITVGAMIDQVATLPTRGVRERKENEGVKSQNESEQKDEKSEKSEQKASKSSSESNTTTESESSWRVALSRSWNEMKDLIKIQHHTKPIEPILSTEEEQLAREYLRLLLEQTRWAILDTNVVVYQGTLNEAKGWLEDYFETTDERVKNLQSEIAKLKDINLTTAVPSLQSFSLIQTMGR